MMRTLQSINVFPKVYLVLFTCFYLYAFAFPSGFAYLALTTMVMFLMYFMFFFWNRHERPALESGSVSAADPREAVLDSKKFSPNGIHYASLALRAILPSNCLIIKKQQDQRHADIVHRKPSVTARNQHGHRRTRQTINMHPMLNESQLDLTLPVDEKEAADNLRHRNSHH
mmetsp:Transcript_20298/g.26341  ORF Transcript_20298/g.26341 Transcript_20298/m.26341 type:complete len:171 (+) Transcript_20298:1307-1819(+)